jgi:hypothetical protein
LHTIFHQLGTKQTCRNLIDVLAQFFIDWDQTDLQKSHRRLNTIFDELATKQNYRNLIDVLAQFFIDWDQTDLETSHRRFGTIFTQLSFSSSEFFEPIFLQFVSPADSLGQVEERLG